MKKNSYAGLLAPGIVMFLLSAAILLFVTCSCGSEISSQSTHSASSKTSDETHEREGIRADEIKVADLPLEAQHMLSLIKIGGPFPYAKDGAVFGNRERMLPPKTHDYYHEYTVKTPGARDRGARRIISGGTREYYYTDDHYRSFKRIRE
jgi:ribonuclease T1